MATEPTSLVFITSDNHEVVVDKHELRWTSKVFQDLLADCDTGHVKVDETKQNMDMLLSVIRNRPLLSTFDIASVQCWEDYRQLLQIADKYDMQLVMDRCEKWLVSRCLRGKVVDQDFRFQDIQVARDWVLICQNLGLKDLGWYCAYDLGKSLADGMWPRQTDEFIKEVNEPELLKTMLAGVNDAMAPPAAEQIAEAVQELAGAQLADGQP